MIEECLIIHTDLFAAEHFKHLAPVVQRMDNFLSAGLTAIQRINFTHGVMLVVQSMDGAIHFLSIGYIYPSFEQPGLAGIYRATLKKGE